MPPARGLSARGRATNGKMRTKDGVFKNARLGRRLSVKRTTPGRCAPSLCSLFGWSTPGESYHLREKRQPDLLGVGAANFSHVLGGVYVNEFDQDEGVERVKRELSEARYAQEQVRRNELCPSEPEDQARSGGEGASHDNTPCVAGIRFAAAGAQRDLSGARRDAMGLDPVCRMEVKPASAEAQSEYEGVTFYFCSQACKEKFDREPLRYVDETDLAEMRVRRSNPAA
jgi:YHS domain-containing protein